VVLDHLEWSGEAKKLAARAAERHPDHPVIRLAKSVPCALKGRWREVIELLTPVDPEALNDRSARHLHHLLGSALLMKGRSDEAWDVWTRGETYPGPCELEGLIGLSQPLSPLSDDRRPDLGPEASAVLRLASAIRIADACLARDDAHGAREAVGAIGVWEAQEIQSLARLAEALLREPAGPSNLGFSKALALAAYLGVHAETVPFRRRELPLPHDRWDKGQLDAIAEKARGWLDSTLGGA
jgi:hypothetical protein